jgi:hypothetical protein
MATITVRLTGLCGGGNHATLSVTGDRSMSFVSDVEAMSQALTEDEAETFVRVLIRMSRAGKTLAQWRTALQAGITVTV